MADEDAVIKIGGDVEGILKALQSIEKQFGAMGQQLEGFANKAGPSLDKANSFFDQFVKNLIGGSTAGAFFGAQLSKAFDQVVSGISSALTAIPALIQRTADVGDMFRDMSNATGVSVEALSAFNFVASQTGTSLEAIARTIFDLGRRLQEGGDEIKKAVAGLGLNFQQLKAQKPEDAFVSIFAALQQLPTAAERATAGMAIFGPKFRAIANLAKEDVAGLMQQAKDLNLVMSTETAEAADRFNDAMDVISKMADATRMQIGAALLPAVTAIAEKAPLAGGAMILLGQNMLGVVNAIAPMTAALALLKTGVAAATTWVSALGNSIPVLTARLWLMDAAGGKLALTLGLLGKAAGLAGAAFAGWAIGTVIRDIELFDGKLKTLGETFEFGAAKWLQWLGLAEKVDDADLELAISSRRAAEEQKKLGEAVAQTATGPKGFDALSAAVKAAEAELAKLSKTQREQLTKALKDGVNSMKDIEDQTGLSSQALALFKQRLDESEKSLEKQKQAFEKSPLGKFTADLEQLTTQLASAEKAGAPAIEVFGRFGEAASKMVVDARLVDGAFEKLPENVKRLGAEWDKAQLAIKMDELREAAVKAQREVQKAAEEAGVALIKRLESAFNQSKEFADKLVIATKTGLERQLAEIDQAEKAALEKLGDAPAGYEDLWRQHTGNIKAYFADLRNVALKFTGDVVRDAELRGIKTRAELEREADTERKVLAEMLANREKFTQAAIDQQRQRTTAAEAAAKGERDSLQSIAAAFVAMGQAAQGSLGAILGGVGQLLVSLDAARQLAAETGQQFGTLSGVFDRNATSMSRFASGVAAAASIAQGLNDVMAATSKSATAAGNALGGAMAGAKAGAAFGPWGIAIGAAAGLVVGLIRGKPDWAKAADEVGRDFGVKISKGLAEQIVKTSKEFFKGDRFAAEVFHLSDIIQAAGGITEKNFDKLLGGLRDTFVMLETGMFTVEQAREVLDKNFGAFAEHVVKSGKVASKEFVEILQLNARFGTQSKEVADFVTAQTSRLGKAFAALIAPMRKPTQELTEEIKKQQVELDKLKDKGGKAYDDQKKRVDELLAKQKEMAAKTLPEIERAARLLTASFNAAVASGASMVDAVDQLGPGLDTLLQTMKDLGINVADSSVAWVVAFRERVQANRELVDSAASLNEIMLAMSNIGALNVDTLRDLEMQGQSTFDKLTAAGFGETESLTMMKGFLQSVIDSHKQLGIPIDENTQKLIDQATAAGVLKEEQVSMNDIMMEGLGAIIEALGGKLPEAWQKAKQAAVDATNTTSQEMKEVGSDVDSVKNKLDTTTWAQWAGRGVASGRLAEGAVDGAAGAVDEVARSLDQTDWAGWAREAVDAAGDAADAVDEVSFGESPGGLKEIPLMLESATEAARQFAETMTEQMSSAKAAADAVPPAGVPTQIAGETITRAAAETTRAAAAAAPAGGGDEIHLSFTIQSLDPAGVELAVERRILPAMVKVLKRGKNLKDLQDLIP